MLLSDIQQFVENLEDESQDSVKKFATNNGGHIHKLIKVLQDDEVTEKDQDFSLVLAAVTPFIIRSQTDLPDLEQSAVEIGQEIISTHLKSVEKLLCSDRKYAVIALKFLTGIANLNYELAKEILLELQITPDTMENLASNQKVRPFFMEFILSFIAKNSSALFSLLINKSKNMFNTIIVGLVVDNAEQVIKFLSTIEHFLKMVPLADNLKLKAFQSSTLAHLAELYKWQGPGAFKKFFKPVKAIKKPRLEPVSPVDDTEKEMVRSKTHEFLELLCTSEQYGVVSADLVFKSTIDQTNGHLINFLKNKILNDVWTDSLQATLLTKVLTVSPNLMESIFSKVSIPSTHMLLFLKIMQEIAENSKFHGNNLRLENYPEVTMKLCLPPCISPWIKGSLENTDCVTRYATICFLITCMKKLNEYIELYSKRNGTRNVNYYFASYIQKNVAPAQLLSSIWSQDTEFRSVIIENGEKITEEMYFASLAELLILCFDLSPSFADSICQHFADISYDSCLFFSPRPFLKVFSLLSYLNKIDPNQVEFRHGLQRVIVIMISEKSEEAKQLFYRLMTSSRLVEGTENELIVWVHSFSVIESSHSQKIAELFALAVEYLANEASELCQLSDNLDECAKKFVSASNIEDFIAKVTGELSSFTSGTTQLNISLLFLAFLKNLTVDKRKMNDAVAKSLNTFITNLIIHSFHSQFNPEAFISFISQDIHRKIIPGDPIKYAKSWLSKSKKSSKDQHLLMSCGFDDITLESQLCQLFLSPDATHLKNFYESLKGISPEHLSLLLRFCVFTAAQNIFRSSLSAALAENLSSTILFILKCLPNTLKESCLQFSLMHPTLLESFSPLDVSNSTSNSVFLMIPIIEEAPNLAQSKIQLEYLTPYKVKFLKQLRNEITGKNELKGNKKMLLTVISCLKLKDTDAVELINQIFTSFESLTDTWNDVVAQLLEIISENKLNTALPGHLVAVLCSRLPNKRLQQAVVSYFNAFPHSVEFIPREFIKKLLKLKEINALALLLLSLNPSFIEIVVDDWDTVKNKPGIVFPVLTAVSGNFDITDEILKKVVQSHLSDLSNLILSPPAWFVEHNQVISQLVYRFSESDTALEECRKIEEMWFEIEARPDIIPVLETLYNKAGQTLKLTELLLIWTVQLIMSHKLDQLEVLLETISDCCLIDSSYTNYYSLTKLSVWSQFVKLALKHGLGEENQPLLECLAVLSEAVFSAKNLEGAQTLFDMMVSHSNFIKIVLSKSGCKGAILKLFLTLVKVDSSRMKPSHVPLFLGAYNASLSTVDQIILQILHTYEKCGIKLNKCQPYIWGETAINHFTVRSKTVTLHKQLPPVKLLDLLTASRIDTTIKRFPTNRDDKLIELVEPDDEIYDPAFLIPVLNSILASESTVRWFQVTRSGAISILLASLSLTDSVLRNTAYLALSKFYQHLQTGEKSRALWIQLLDIVRNGVADAGLNESDTTPQLSSIITTFLARTSIVLIEPSSPLFRPLVSFVTVKPTLRLNQVPEFLILFFSSSKDSRLHRKWLLEVIRDGMKTENDWKLCQSYIFKIMLTFYSSSLADDEIQELILEVMKSTAKVSNAAIYLATSYGFIAWLDHIIHSLPGPSTKSIPVLIELLSILGPNLPLRYSSAVLNLSLNLVQSINTLSDYHLSIYVSSLRFISRKARQPIPPSTLLSILTNIAPKVSPGIQQICQYYLKHGIKYSPRTSIDNSKNTDQDLMALFEDYL